MMIKSYALVSNHHLLKVEFQHYELLLQLLQAEISLISYLEHYKFLYSSEDENSNVNYALNIAFFEKLQKFSLLRKRHSGVIYVNPEVHCFINVLQICKDNISKHIDNKNYKMIDMEIYYNHNVPSLIESNNKELIFYYISVEQESCRNQCPKEMIQSYKGIWQEIEKQLK